MNESMFVAIDDQSAALSIGGTNGFPICCFPIFCWPKPQKTYINEATATAGANATGSSNTTTNTGTTATVVYGASSSSGSGSYAKAY